MKGLMIKDLMCLRKQMILFAYTVAGVLALSIMFVLSVRFGNIADANQTMIFRMDGKAGFSSISSILPLSVNKRVLAKYLTVFMMFGIGVVVDIVISFVLSMFTDIISFVDFFGIIISAASLMCIYGNSRLCIYVNLLYLVYLVHGILQRGNDRRYCTDSRRIYTCICRFITSDGGNRTSFIHFVWKRKSNAY